MTHRRHVTPEPTVSFDCTPTDLALIEQIVEPSTARPASWADASFRSIIGIQRKQRHD